MSDRSDWNGNDRLLADARAAAQGRKNDRELQKIAVLVIDDAGLNRVKAGWFTDWYSSLKRELGMG